jgi:hypothetical protein
MSQTNKDEDTYKPLKYSEIKQAAGSAEKSGGLSGSLRIKLGEKLWQYKFSLFNKKGADWRKSKVKGGTDHENIGELFSASIGNAISSKKDSNRQDIFSINTPEVKFVGLDPEAKKGKNYGISIASKYLDDFKPFSSLLKNIPYSKIKKDKDGNPKTKEISHVTIRFREKGAEDVDFKQMKKSKLHPLKESKIHGYIYVTDSKMQQGICDALALNMLFGNADINSKGNLGKTKDGKIGAIDFGHAFNNLIHEDGILAKGLGGGGVHHSNGILDFINRDKLLGGRSKLWRDYEAVIPSEAFAKSLHNMADTKDEVRKGVQNAYEQMLALAGEYKDKGNQQMFIDSLQRLNRNVGKEDITDYKNLTDLISKTTDNLEMFATTRCDQMKEVAQMMDLQVEIDKQLKKGTVFPNILKDVQSQYDEIIIDKPVQSITWVKTGAKDKPHIGDLSSYINIRQKQLERDKVIEIVKDVRIKKKFWAAEVLNGVGRAEKKRRDSGIGLSRSSLPSM